MNFEKMLGSMVGSFLTGSKSNKERSSTGSSSGIMSQIQRGLTSPQGLMAAAGLAFGAFEAYQRTQKGADAGQSPLTSPAPGVPMPSSSATPPPVPGAPPVPSAVTPPPIPGAPVADSPQADDSQAVTLIQAMIAAAWADGHMDDDERNRILSKAKECGVSSDEEQWLIHEIQNPRSIVELTAGVSDHAFKTMIYGLSYAAIEEDSAEETQYLNNLASALGLSDDETRTLKDSF